METRYRMTVKQLAKACEKAIREKKYLIVRTSWYCYGANPRLLFIEKPDLTNHKRTNIISYRLVDFQEYLTNKVPFIKSK